MSTRFERAAYAIVLLAVYAFVAWTRLIAVDERALLAQALRGRILRRTPAVGETA
jgi:hypothetical protein